VEFHNESSLAYHVGAVLRDIFGGYGLNDDKAYPANLLNTWSKYGQQGIPFFWLSVRMCRQSVGVLEVALPAEKFTDQQYGQVWGYLQQLRQCRGVKNPIAILTDYVHWQACWLPESEQLAMSDDPLGRFADGHDSKELPFPPQPTLVPFSLPTPEEIQKEMKLISSVPVANSASPSSALTPVLYHSESVMYNDKDNLSPFIFSVIFKMCCSELTEVNIADCRDRIYIVASPRDISWSFSFYDEDTKRLDFINPPPDDTNKYALLQHLGSGSDGQVWLCSSASGHVGVLKMTSEANVKRECTGWSVFLQHYKSSWRVKPLKFRSESKAEGVVPLHAIVMPCVYAKADWSSAKWQDGVKEAIRILAHAGYTHGDLQLRHFGFLVNSKGEEQPVLFDLSRIEQVAEDKKAEAEAEMLKEFEVGWGSLHDIIVPHICS